MTSTLPNLKTDISYPDSDGQPMADNTKQFRWIVTIKENLELLFAEQADVFVAGDLFWYPVEGDNKTRQAPDTLVVFGRPKGDRGSYQQWKEDNIPPQIVFEILSPGNRPAEMLRKFKFYERYGVEEYYIYDPDELELAGWERQGKLVCIDEMDGWVSPRLNIRFVMKDDGLEIYRPDGRKFLTMVDMEQQTAQEKQRADDAEALLAKYQERFGSLE